MGDEMTKNFLICLVFIILMAFPAAAETNAGELKMNNSSLISRDLLFGNPDRVAARISPDGSMMSFLAPVNGVLNVWVGPADQPKRAKPVTNDTYRGIRSYFWGYTNNHILFLQDRNGDENWRIYSVNLSRGSIKDLTPFEGVRSQIQQVSPKYPMECIIGLNRRDPEYHDLFRLNIETGNLTLLLENTRFSDFVVDDDFKIRLASNMTPDGGIEMFKPMEDGTWTNYMKIDMEDTLSTGFSGFNKTNEVAYLADSRGRDTAALYTLNLKTGEKSLVAEDAKSDFNGAMYHPTEKNVQAVAFYYDKLQWKIIDPSISGDMDYLSRLQNGEIRVASRSLDDRIWIVAYTVDDGPTRYYYYDRSKKQSNFLFTDREKLNDKPLCRMIPAVIRSRDGLDLLNYYTLPRGSDANDDGLPDHPLPMVLYVHGGPWSRDYWGLDFIQQWLANRGYAVLSVNFRGSTGFGKNFTNAGNLEWGRKMQEDLIDAARWSVKKGIADPNKIAIMGASYGGYAVLEVPATAPRVFACGVDIVGPSNLITLLQTIPPYWKPEIERYTKRVGDFGTEEGRKLLRERSPLTFANQIERPLLIGQGANDPRVKQNESDQIVKAMQSKGLPVTYVLYADEGHGFARPENKLSFYAIVEAFLAEHLGGSYQPIGQDFVGSNFTVPAGAGAVLGLAEALRANA
ncbi:Acylamino-acid-releasing enzyme [uncultured archaeon]|nr:Acylamino-acid-releasing enzyme [uncultured archaeon]